MGGAFGLFAVNLIATTLYEASRNNRSEAASIAPAAVTMLFLFNLIYAATWGMVAFLGPDGDLPPGNVRAGQRFWHNWLDNRHRLDCSHQPNHVHGY